MVSHTLAINAGNPVIHAVLHVERIYHINYIVMMISLLVVAMSIALCSSAELHYLQEKSLECAVS